MKEENILKIQEKYQMSQTLDEQLKIVEQQVLKLQQFSQAINFLEENGEMEILAPIGKGVFVKSEMKEKDFFVDVGSGIFVKKKSGDTKKIIDEQVSKLMKMKIQLDFDATGLNEELRELIELTRDEKDTKSI